MQLKKELDLDREAGGIFISFLEKLIEKRRGYTTVSNPEEVNHSDKIFKVYHDTVSILTDNLEENLSLAVY